MIERIISGGQTGADQGGLDGALAYWNDPSKLGGWCPAGRRSEEGPIPARYPLQETAEWDYPPRTRLNIMESDGTVVFTVGAPTRGSSLTIDMTVGLGKPILHVDLHQFGEDEAVEQVVDFVDSYGLCVLNVAGTRESSAPGIQEAVAQIISRALSELA